MSWKRSLMETTVWCVARASRTERHQPRNPRSIFVLRNNDLGDVLVVTPLFEALRRRFPEARIVAGVGGWAVPLLYGNPHLSEVVLMNAPWHNKFLPRQGWFAALKYLCTSDECRAVAQQQFEVGIDVLGSAFGSLLMLRCGVPYRLGVRGYAGGHSAAQQRVRFSASEHVGRSALRFAEMLGATELPEVRPQIFLSPQERDEAEHIWRPFREMRRAAGCLPAGLAIGSAGETPAAPMETGGARPLAQRVVVAPGGGFPEKCWPPDHWRELIRLLARQTHLAVVIVGGPQDRSLGESLVAAPSTVHNLAGQTSLRQTFALVAQADMVLCNSSLLLHVAAAFRKPSVVLLGDWFSSVRAHAAQWAYRESLVLGKDTRQSNIYSPAEAFAVLQGDWSRHAAAA